MPKERLLVVLFFGLLTFIAVKTWRHMAVGCGVSKTVHVKPACPPSHPCGLYSEVPMWQEADRQTDMHTDASSLITYDREVSNKKRLICKNITKINRYWSIPTPFPLSTRQYPFANVLGEKRSGNHTHACCTNPVTHLTPDTNWMRPATRLLNHDACWTTSIACVLSPYACCTTFWHVL